MSARSKLVLLSTLLSPIWATETSCEHSHWAGKGNSIGYKGSEGSKGYKGNLAYKGRVI